MKAKLRFHLAKGANFMKWQLTTTTGSKVYRDPKAFHCFQIGKLKSQKGAASKIHQGANKTVCAWIEYSNDPLSFKTGMTKEVISNFKKVYYNPRKLPYWHDEQGNNLDNQTGTVAVIDKQIYLLEG